MRLNHHQSKERTKWKQDRSGGFFWLRWIDLFDSLQEGGGEEKQTEREREELNRLDIIRRYITFLSIVIEFFHVPPFIIAVIIDLSKNFQSIADIQRENTIHWTIEIIQCNVNLDRGIRRERWERESESESIPVRVRSIEKSWNDRDRSMHRNVNRVDWNK